jgi:hypothetical protein
MTFPNFNVELFVNILKDIPLFYFHYTVMLLIIHLMF